MRLFVAVYPPDEVADHLAGHVAQLRVGRAAEQGVNARLASRPNWHVTLAFLGVVADDRLDHIRTAVAAGVAGRAPVLRVAGGGRFGRGRFTVLWAGLTGDVAAVTELARSVRRQLSRARLPFDRKPLKPHLTIARPGDRLPPPDLMADLAALDDYVGPQWPVEAVRLVRSHLGPRPTYDNMGEWALPVGSAER